MASGRTCLLIVHPRLLFLFFLTPFSLWPTPGHLFSLFLSSSSLFIRYVSVRSRSGCRKYTGCITNYALLLGKPNYILIHLSRKKVVLFDSNFRNAKQIKRCSNCHFYVDFVLQHRRYVTKINSLKRSIAFKRWSLKKSIQLLKVNLLQLKKRVAGN